MNRNRNVKMLVTLGPACFEEDMIRRLYEAGADTFRINMSHTDHQLMRTLIEKIRKIEQELNAPIGILIDIQGPKLRIGNFISDSQDIQVGEVFTLDKNPNAGDAHRVYFSHFEVYESLKVGERIIIDDGKVELSIIALTPESIVCRIIAGKKISNKKGVSFPDTNLNISFLTEKDKQDLEAALKEKIDWVALSFIQKPENLEEARAIVQGRALIMSKIEKPQAFEKIERIITLSDGLMVARGDLGVEMDLEKVPEVQQKIVYESQKAGKPVVVATQMLESMILSPSPTRAEVSDVSTAVLQGADAIMLSAESASGQYPVESVAMMDKIAKQAEKNFSYGNSLYESQCKQKKCNAMAIAASQISYQLNISGIFLETNTETVPLCLSQKKPKAPIVVFSQNITMARRFTLVWGVFSFMCSHPINSMIEEAYKIADTKKTSSLAENIIILTKSSNQEEIDTLHIRDVK